MRVPTPCLTNTPNSSPSRRGRCGRADHPAPAGVLHTQRHQDESVIRRAVSRLSNESGPEPAPRVHGENDDLGRQVAILGEKRDKLGNGEDEVVQTRLLHGVAVELAPDRQLGQLGHLRLVQGSEAGWSRVVTEGANCCAYDEMSFEAVKLGKGLNYERRCIVSLR